MKRKVTNIYLIGYRCTGKSTIGRALADRRGLDFCDTDELIAAGEQETIAEIVANRGWPYFRNLEKECVRRLAEKKNSVIATGGGIVLHPGNIARMQNSGAVIWLRARPQTVLYRMLLDPATTFSRPALTRQEIEKEVLATMEARRELYSQAADLSFRTDLAQPEEIVSEILQAISVSRVTTGDRR